MGGKFVTLVWVLLERRAQEVQRPLATVVIGGIITATLLSLLVLPALCRLTVSTHASGTLFVNLNDCLRHRRH
jgi:Cu/Ag efflux pump CusA